MFGIGDQKIGIEVLDASARVNLGELLPIGFLKFDSEVVT